MYLIKTIQKKLQYISSYEDEKISFLLPSPEIESWFDDGLAAAAASMAGPKGEMHLEYQMRETKNTMKPQRRRGELLGTRAGGKRSFFNYIPSPFYS